MRYNIFSSRPGPVPRRPCGTHCAAAAVAAATSLPYDRCPCHQPTRHLERALDCSVSASNGSKASSKGAFKGLPTWAIDAGSDQPLPIACGSGQSRAAAASTARVRRCTSASAMPACPRAAPHPPARGAAPARARAAREPMYSAGDQAGHHVERLGCALMRGAGTRRCQGSNRSRQVVTPDPSLNLASCAARTWKKTKKSESYFRQRNEGGLKSILKLHSETARPLLNSSMYFLPCTFDPTSSAYAKIWLFHEYA